MPKKKTILYYISSHGFGHAARAGKVIKELKRRYNIIVKTYVPKWLLEQVAGNGICIYPEQFDVGCIQISNVTVDIKKTFEKYMERSRENKKALESECRFIKENKVGLIISDIASFPFVIAENAGIPSIFIGNFTWKGIYQYFFKTTGYNGILKELEYEYGLADYSLVTPLSVDMPELSNKKRINFIARRGKNIRMQLNRHNSIASSDKLVFFYAGSKGTERAEPELIKRLKGYIFVSFYPLKIPVKNYIFLEPGSYRHEDIMASCDIALVKAGYGMVSEAMVNEVPIIYPPREDFQEYFAFVEEFKRSGGTVQIERESFETGNWGDALLRIKDVKYNKMYASTGAVECLEEVEKIIA